MATSQIFDFAAKLAYSDSASTAPSNVPDWLHGETIFTGSATHRTEFDQDVDHGDPLSSNIDIPLGQITNVSLLVIKATPYNSTDKLLIKLMLDGSSDYVLHFGTKTGGQSALLVFPMAATGHASDDGCHQVQITHVILSGAASDAYARIQACVFGD